MIWTLRRSASEQPATAIDPGAADRGDLYADWAPGYPSEAHNPLMAVEQQAVLQLVPPIAGLRVLDAGCGTGRYAKLLAARGPRSIVAIDCSAAMLAFACDCAATYVRGDIRALPLANACVDVIVSGLMLPDVDDLALVVREWARVLVPGGTVVSSTLHSIGAELGWTRTFDTPHGTRSLPAHWHTADQYRAVCAAAGLVADAVVEPTLHPDPDACESLVSWLPPSGGSCELRSFFRPKPEATQSPRVPVAMVFRATRARRP